MNYNDDLTDWADKQLSEIQEYVLRTYGLTMEQFKRKQISKYKANSLTKHCSTCGQVI